MLVSTSLAQAARASASPDELYEKFAKGEAQLIQPTLVSGYGAAAKFGARSAEVRRLYEQSQWRDLALTVIDIGFGGDLSWFFLGRAAEEARLFDVAIKYYEKSLKDSKRKAISGCVGSGCLGIQLPQEANERLRLIREYLETTKTASP